MGKKNMNIGDKKIKTSYLYKNKKIIKIDDIDVNKILVSKEESYGSKNSFKCFIKYNDDDITRPLCIKLPQMIGYVRIVKSDMTMSLRLVTNIVKKLLKKYNQIWKKIKDLLNIKSDSKPVYRDNDKYIKAKIKIFNDNANTNFQGKGVPKEKASSAFYINNARFCC